MINHIAECIRTVCKNHTEIYPIKNMLYAKMVTLAGLKNVKFDSVLNVMGESPLSHYALNFVPSGGNKNNSINAIDKYLFDFVKDEIENINKGIKADYVTNELSKVKKDIELAEKNIKEDAESQEQLQFYINDATPEAIYDNIELIKKLGKGFLFSKNTEYAQYYEKSVYDKTSNNSKFLDIFYDASDGVFASRKIRGKTRPEINGITVASAWMSDFTRMKDSLVNTNFKNRLIDGYVRRIYPYYDPRINYTLNPPQKATTDDIIQAKRDLKDYRDLIYKTYNDIKFGTVYQVTQGTIDILQDWHEEVCMDRARELYKGRNRQLDLNNAILEKSLSNAIWTVLKLLVIMHMINEPTKIDVDDTYLDEAIRFWEEGYKSWQNIIFDKNYTDSFKKVLVFL